MDRTPLRRSLRIAAALTGLLLMVPLVAMQFSTEVRWGPGDFAAAASLLFLAFGAIALALARLRGTVARAAVVTAILLCLAVVWAELAVGLFR